jgi:hypothetical protein
VLLNAVISPGVWQDALHQSRRGTGTLAHTRDPTRTSPNDHTSLLTTRLVTLVDGHIRRTIVVQDFIFSTFKVLCHSSTQDKTLHYKSSIVACVFGAAVTSVSQQYEGLTDTDCWEGLTDTGCWEGTHRHSLLGGTHRHRLLGGIERQTAGRGLTDADCSEGLMHCAFELDSAGLTHDVHARYYRRMWEHRQHGGRISSLISVPVL